MKNRILLPILILMIGLGIANAQQIGINTTNPKGDFQLIEKGATSNLVNVQDFGTTMVITGNVQNPRIYFEDTDGSISTIETPTKVMMNRFENGKLSWHAMNDDGSAFVTNVMSMNTGTIDLSPLPKFNYSYIGMGLDQPKHPLHLVSGAYCDSDGEWTNASDRRLKENITPISYGLKDVLALTPVQYNMKSTGNSQIGFIAQDVKELIPELISGTEGDVDKGETLGMSYGNLTSVLVKAIQEQQEMIDELKVQNKALTAGLAQLQDAVMGTAHVPSEK